MLRSEHSIVTYDRGRAIPDRLTRVTHRHYLAYASRMMEVYRQGVGTKRRELHRAIAAVFAAEPDFDRRRISAFSKLLDDAGEFDVDKKGQAAAVRLKVFALAAPRHPLVEKPDLIFERSEGETKRMIAGELGRSWGEIEAGLYVDVMDRQPLLRFEGYPSAEALLTRYNLAQLQACLYRSQSMTVLAREDFAAIVRYAKLARLLVDSRRVGEDEYRIVLSGPASVLGETRRYGIDFARFVSALVACRGWEMRARVTRPWGGDAELRVKHDDGYRSHVMPTESFDSDVEEALAKKWGDSRDGWRLVREGGILQDGQFTFVPDFRLHHDDGREVFLEIVGFWTPEYLDAKRKTIARFRDRKIVLAVPTRTAKEGAGGPGVVIYKTRIKPEEVVRAAGEVCAVEG